MVPTRGLCSSRVWRRMFLSLTISFFSSCVAVVSAGAEVCDRFEGQDAGGGCRGEPRGHDPRMVSLSCGDEMLQAASSPCLAPRSMLVHDAGIGRVWLAVACLREADAVTDDKRWRRYPGGGYPWQRPKPAHCRSGGDKAGADSRCLRRPVRYWSVARCCEMSRVPGCPC